MPHKDDPRTKGLTYNDGLGSLYLHSVYQVRTKGFVRLEVLRSQSRTASLLFSPHENPSIRGHSTRFNKIRAPKNIGTTFFSLQKLSAWDKLPKGAVSAIIVAKFRARLKKAWQTLFPKFTWDCFSFGPYSRIFPKTEGDPVSLKQNTFFLFPIQY